MHDLHMLPKVRDSWSYLYVEHCRIDQEDRAIALHDANGKTPVPCASLALLMVGPGTTMTHAAIRVLAETGCTVLWVGERGVRCYAQGLGETRSSHNLLRQVRLWSDPALHLRVVRLMYAMRFTEPLDHDLTLQQIRGKEGIRVREAYARASREYGVEWHGRAYNRQDWAMSDPVNRALSAANSCLYGVCHAAILSAGYSPALGFVHTGRQLSFVYDIADLYKVDLTIPAAFAAVADGTRLLETSVRWKCRDLFHEKRLLARIVDDIASLLGIEDADVATEEDTRRVDEDMALPGDIWDPTGEVDGGVNYGEVEQIAGGHP
jgi:CRISPR-associated protein Cas1